MLHELSLTQAVVGVDWEDMGRKNGVYECNRAIADMRPAKLIVFSPEPLQSFEEDLVFKITQLGIPVEVVN